MKLDWMIHKKPLMPEILIMFAHKYMFCLNCSKYHNCNNNISMCFTHITPGRWTCSFEAIYARETYRTYYMS